MIYNKPNLISLFLVIGALAGNASIEGLDLFLLLSVPAGIVVSFQQRTANLRRISWWVLLGGLALWILTVRSIDIGMYHFPRYWIWPIKVAVLAFLLTYQKGRAWPFYNDLLLGVFSVGLLLTATIEGGRLTSFFGPNMLYRFFGVSMAFSLIRAGYVVGFPRTLSLVVVAANAVGILLTGSVGAVAVLLVVAYFSQSSLRILIRSPLGAFAAFCSILGLFALRELLKKILVSRLEKKYNNLEDDERYFAWSRMLDVDPGWGGVNYSDLYWIWSSRMPYPHNIFVELWLFYGGIGLAIAAVSLIAFVSMRSSRYYFVIPAVIILIGSLFSGELSENFGALALPLVYFANKSKFVRSKRQSPPFKRLMGLTGFRGGMKIE